MRCPHPRTQPSEQTQEASVNSEDTVHNILVKGTSFRPAPNTTCLHLLCRLYFCSYFLNPARCTLSCVFILLNIYVPGETNQKDLAIMELGQTHKAMSEMGVPGCGEGCGAGHKSSSGLLTHWLTFISWAKGGHVKRALSLLKLCRSFFSQHDS